MKSLAGRRFAPSWFSVLLTVALLPLFLRLGFWQLERAAVKQQLQAQAAQGQQQVIAADAAQAATLPRYQQLRLAGRFDAAHQILLDSMPSARGQAGYRVLTPLHLTTGQVVLVDRGWIPLPRPGEPTLNLAVHSELREVVGMLDELPAPGLRAGEAGIDTRVWPQRLNYPRHDELQRLFSAPLLPRIVLLNADQPDGFERRWQVRLDGLSPQRHIAYAVQWFGFALTLLILFIVVNLKRIEADPAP